MKKRISQPSIPMASRIYTDGVPIHRMLERQWHGGNSYRESRNLRRFSAIHFFLALQTIIFALPGVR